MPVLIIQGTKDESVNYEYAKEVIDLFPNGRLHLIEGADHLLGIDGDYSEGQKVLVDFFKQ